MKSKITYREQEFIVDVPKYIEIISKYNNSAFEPNEDFMEAYFYLQDYYKTRLIELLGEDLSKEEEELIVFEGFYQNDEGLIDVANYEKA
jgi:hypothetical protein